MKTKRPKRKLKAQPGGSLKPVGSANLRELANTFRRMGDDANHVRLSHLKPRKGYVKSDTMIRETHASAAIAYYNAMRHVQVLLPNKGTT
jgi:hypothetical protein